MAHIHRTAGMVPTKLDLLVEWLPQQAWYAGRSGPPQLTRAGGFRLDDPAGEVGIEFFFVADEAGDDATTYHVPMSYRGAPLPSAEPALIGTAEHGALGPRWIYDGTQDPVVMETLAALLAGEAEPQHQTESNTADPSVTVHGARAVEPDRIEIVRVLTPVGGGGDAYVEASWRSADGSSRRGPVVVTT